MAEELAIGDEARQRQIGRAAGAMLARLQTHRFNTPGFFVQNGGLKPSGELPPFRAHIAASLLRDGGAANLGPELTPAVLHFVDDHAELIPTEGPWVLVHGDYKASNLLLRDESSDCRVSGILDWEFSFAGPALFDLTMLLRYSDSMPGFEAGVVEGYRAGGGVLPENWKQRVRLLDLVNLCGFLTVGDRSEERLRDVRGLIAYTLERLATYGPA